MLIMRDLRTMGVMPLRISSYPLCLRVRTMSLPLKISDLCPAMARHASMEYDPENNFVILCFTVSKRAPFRVEGHSAYRMLFFAMKLASPGFISW